MATTMYRWNKYTIKETTTYTEPDWGMPSSTTYQTGTFSGYSNYTFDSTTGTYSVGGSATYSSTNGPYYGDIYSISSDGKGLYRTSFGGTDSNIPPRLKVSNYSKGVTEEVTRGQGDYIEEVRSTDVNAYPMNGEKDGYWYYYNMYIIIPDIKAYVNIGGVAKEVGAIYVNVDGVVKKVSDLYCNIGGVAKKYNQ